MIRVAITVFDRIMNSHAHRRVIVKVASKNRAVVRIYSQCWPKDRYCVGNLLLINNKMQKSILKPQHKHFQMHLNLYM